MLDLGAMTTWKYPHRLLEDVKNKTLAGTFSSFKAANKSEHEKKATETPLVGQTEPQPICSYLLLACDSQTTLCFDVKPIPRLPYSTLSPPFLFTQQTSLIPEEGETAVDWGCCSAPRGAQTLPWAPWEGEHEAGPLHSLEQAAGWSRLPSALCCLAPRPGLGTLRRMCQGRSGGKSNIPATRPCRFKQLTLSEVEKHHLILSVLGLLKTVLRNMKHMYVFCALMGHTKPLF